ncbi:hypothetical protein F2Q70_00008173 [Brassica cretica]|uniref:Epidermal patterning factor-like protein n=3 Tax=Brassica cretica TaxID=69181 RepID=A0A8S9M4R7_BRACR|nr:hypothetical protein F2Q70_00008173 [Brassica cretica]
MLRRTEQQRCHVLLKRISAVRFASAHEDKYSNRLWSVHHIWVPALRLYVFQSRPSIKLEEEGKSTLVIKKMRRIGDWSKEAELDILNKLIMWGSLKGLHNKRRGVGGVAKIRMDIGDCDGMLRRTEQQRCHVLLKRISAVRFASAHEDKYSNRLWSVHHIWVPALRLSVFQSRPSIKLEEEGKSTLVIKKMRRIGDWSKEAELRRILRGLGSSPPRCTSKCEGCTPCRPVHVPVPSGTPVTAEYYPEAWRCKCGNKLYMP